MATKTTTVKIVTPQGTYSITAKGIKDGPRAKVQPFSEVPNLPAGVRRAIRKALDGLGRRADVRLTLPPCRQ